MSGKPVETNGSGILFVITAPSGTGKTSLCRRLLDNINCLKFSVSHTTRPARENEKEGVDYYFVDDETFEQMTRDGKFIEYAYVYGRRYGTSHAEVEKAIEEKNDLLIEIDCKGAQQLRKARPESIGIFIIPPSIEALRERLASRGTESDEEIERRLAIAGLELSDYPHFNYAVINDDFETAAEQLQSIVLAERCRIERKRSVIESLLNSTQ